MRKAKEPEPTTSEYLRDLATRLMGVPIMYGTDQYDVDTLLRIARELETPCTTS